MEEEVYQLEYINKSEVAETGKLISEINYRPTDKLLGCLVIGAAITILINNIFVRIIGILIIAAGIYGLMKIGDHRVIDVYDDALLIYDQQSGKVARLPLEDIVEYDVDRERTNLITLFLKGGSSFTILSFQSSKLLDAFEKVMPGRSHMQLYMNSLKSSDKSFTEFLKDFTRRK